MFANRTISENKYDLCQLLNENEISAVVFDGDKLTFMYTK